MKRSLLAMERQGEVEEIHSDHYVLDDEKYRARHEDLNRDTNGIFSSESEIYNDHNHHSLSSKHEGKRFIRFNDLIISD